MSENTLLPVMIVAFVFALSVAMYLERIVEKRKRSYLKQQRLNFNNNGIAVDEYLLSESKNSIKEKKDSENTISAGKEKLPPLRSKILDLEQISF